MKIELHEIPIRDVVNGYINNAEEGVVGYGGQLNIRPKYQREFIYKDKERNAVIDTVTKGFPLNTMYWMKNEDGTFEVLDGQQRTISICSYVNNEFSMDFRYFFNLLPEEQEKFLDYKLMVYFCEGTDVERLEWFKTINIAGEELTEQELRNAVYTGTWLTDAKKYFSKTGCPASDLGGKYLSGSAIRQQYLETVLTWKANAENKKIEQYMAEHQHDPQASPLWLYFTTVLEWVKATFPKYRKEMKGIDWGSLYEQCKDKVYDPTQLEAKVAELMEDDDVSNKKGIYTYVLTGSEKALNIRAFTAKMKREAYERQNGICTKCGKHFEIEEMEGDHIKPWVEGGKTNAENCQMLCKSCNRSKGAK